MSNTPLIPSSPRGNNTTNPTPVEENELSARYYFDLKPRLFTVVDSVNLSQTLKRIRFSSDDDFEGFETVAPEDHVKLFFDKDDDGNIILPEMKNDRWSPQGYTFRDYTIRWLDTENKTIDIDFVLHEHGIGGAWADTATPGDQLGALGPRGSFLTKDVFDWYVLAADETALPALARWLESLREGVPVTAYIEVDGEDSHIDLPTKTDAKVVWLHRDGAPAGSTTLISEAIKNHDFPDVNGFVWVAGESISIKPVRRILKDMNFERDHWDVDGYWRRGVINHDHHVEEKDE